MSNVSDPKAYVCTHVFSGARPVLYLYRDEDGDQILACGGNDHEQSADDWTVVHLAHELAKDDTVGLIVDMARGERAERRSVADSWSRTVLDH